MGQVSEVSNVTIEYEAGGTSPLMSGTYINGSMYDPRKVYVTASYNGVEYGMGQMLFSVVVIPEVVVVSLIMIIICILKECRI